MRKTMVAAIFLTGGLSWIAWSGRAETGLPPSGTTRTGKAPEPTAASRVFAGGIVEGARPEVRVRFEVPGRIKAVHVREGGAVKAGDVLAELESGLADVRLTEARIRLKLAIAERDRLVAESSPAAGDNLPPLPRGQPAARRGLLPAQALREGADAGDAPPADADELIAEGHIALAEAAVRRERLLLDKTRLRAPFDGIVLRAAAEVGESLGPADDRGSFTIVNRAATRVRAFVEEADALRVAPGQSAVVRIDGKPGRDYRGVVSACAPGLRAKEHRHFAPGERLDIRIREVVIDLEDGADLLIGLPVEVFFEPSTGKENRRDGKSS